MALPDALDHLDLAWRLLTGEHLVRVPRAAMAAKLTQSVNSAEEFESRCSALADLLNALNLPKPATLHNMKVKLGELLGAEAGRAQAAVDALRSIVALRAGQQHQGADTRAEQARVNLGLAAYVGNWEGSWISSVWSPFRRLTPFGKRSAAWPSMTASRRRSRTAAARRLVSCRSSPI